MAVDLRERKGMEIAATRRIDRDGIVWLVPSQSGKGKYRVILLDDGATCGCADYELTQKPCKHIFAARFAARRETVEPELIDAATVEVGFPEKAPRPTYSQNWPAYSAAQTNEKALFQVLLHDLCQGIEEPAYTFGRPRLSRADMVFAAAFKVYSTFSGRRFATDLNDAFDKGYISKLPHYNSVFNYLEMKDLTPVLRAMIERASLPLKAVETEFAVDSSGFSSANFVRWYNARYGHEQDNHDWLKVHLMCGVKTNIVTSVEVTGRNSNDSPQFSPLFDATAQNFDVKEVSADKQYSSVANVEKAVANGTVPYVPFKVNSTGESSGSVVWERLWHFYQFKREVFLPHYHRRSNVESTFWMIKSKFGEKIRAKGDTAQVNEVLCKVLGHNICVLIQSIYEMGIDPTFCAAPPPAQKVA